MKKIFFQKFVIVFVLVMLFTCFFVISKNGVSASAGSITMAKFYPSDGETYQVIDHFTEQILSVNTNTTVLVSLDGGKPIPMIYKGLISEVVDGDTITQDWYTWEANIAPLTASGLHSFQFLGKYFVWQENDQYWAEFNYSSNIHTFTIDNPAIHNSSSNKSDFSDKELNIETPESATLKMSQPINNNLKSKGGSLTNPDSNFAFLVGTVCAVAGAILIGAIVVIQIFSRRKNGFNRALGLSP